MNRNRNVDKKTIDGYVLVVGKNSEHRVARGFVGMWVEQQKQIHESANEVPFSLTNNEGVNVEIIDALSAQILGLPCLLSSEYKRSPF